MSRNFHFGLPSLIQYKPNRHPLVHPTVTNAALAAIAPGRPEQFAFPAIFRWAYSIQLLRGSALIAGREALTPSIEVANLTDKRVKYVELGWVCLRRYP